MTNPGSGARRVELPFPTWPQTDRLAWESILAAGDILDTAGAGRHWARATRQTNRHHYGRWLAWLERSGELGEYTSPGERATPEKVRHYAEYLLETVAPRTSASVLIGLKVVLKAMHPEADWRWLMDLTNRINVWAQPVVDRSAQTLPVEQIHNAALSELDRLSRTKLTRRLDRVAYRDTLMVLLLSAAPVRRRNLAMIEIGTHLGIEPSGVSLRFREAETKNRQRLTHPLPRHVRPYLQTYLERVRPSFRPLETCQHLWLGFEGAPLSAHSVYGRIILVTERLLGVRINPHSFRACAATSFANSSAADARLAAPLLGHRYFSTTERHYIRAQQFEASRKVHATLGDITRKAAQRGSS